jgi:hypothetical protein
VKERVREHTLYHHRIPGQTGQVHAHLERKARDNPGHGPAKCHEHRRYPELAEGRRSGNDTREPLRPKQCILEHHQSPETVAQQEQR